MTIETVMGVMRYKSRNVNSCQNLEVTERSVPWSLHKEYGPTDALISAQGSDFELLASRTEKIKFWLI